MKTAKMSWVEAGYAAFARSGPEAIKVDNLAKKLNKSRSGFYHCFGDRAEFEQALFEYHVQEAMRMAAELTPHSKFYPDFVKVGAAHKEYIFFQKQVYILRHKSEDYARAFEQASAITEMKILLIWRNAAGLRDVHPEKARSFFELIRDAIFTRLDFDSFSADSFKKLVDEVNLSFDFLLS